LSSLRRFVVNNLQRQPDLSRGALRFLYQVESRPWLCSQDMIPVPSSARPPAGAQLKQWYFAKQRMRKMTTPSSTNEPITTSFIFMFCHQNCLRSVLACFWKSWDCVQKRESFFKKGASVHVCSGPLSFVPPPT
jgi:hypothetical protein